MDHDRTRRHIFLSVQEVISSIIEFLLWLSVHLVQTVDGRRLCHDHNAYTLLDRVPIQIEHLQDLVNVSDEACIDKLRMDRNAFGRLCFLLQTLGGLSRTRSILIPEQVAMFLSVLTHHEKNRVVKFDFKCSGYTISKCFNAVLLAVCRLHNILLVAPKPINEECAEYRWKLFKEIMEPISSIPNTSSKRKAPCSRRTWTLKEEQLLITALKDDISKGWKCENGFKTGYLGFLENAMAQAIPGTMIKFNSKIHVWKKNYNTISTMLSLSGFGWNDTSHTIDVYSDEVWDSYVKTDSNARKMHFKAWPFYKDWSDTFGKDRANGENAEGFADIVHDILNGDGHNENIPRVDRIMQAGGVEIRDEVDSSATQGGKQSSKKRKERSVENNILVEVITNFCEKTDFRLGEIAKRIGVEYDVALARKEVFETLGNMSFLNDEDNLSAALLLCQDHKELDVFFSLPDDMKEKMVKMKLNGRN